MQQTWTGLHHDGPNHLGLCAFVGNVAAVYTNPLMHTPSASGGHYGGDAYTCEPSLLSCPYLHTSPLLLPLPPPPISVPASARPLPL